MSSSDPISPYHDEDAIRAQVGSGNHRATVGGLWDEIGRLQLEFMIGAGLAPTHRLLDIGCGCLRGGLHFVRYLEPGRYFGTDLNASLLDAGYGEIRDAGLEARLPPANLVQDAEFAFAGLSPPFDFAIAFSLFTHLPFNAIRVCVERVAPLMRAGGTLYATYFEVPEGEPTWRESTHEPGGIVTRATSDPYHYHVSDFMHAARGLPWQLRVVGAFGHPRDQRMLALRRT